ncbi:MAG: molybdenum cofactor guanylyltransferase [Chloroflexi bacterium]|nr:molybdenum cofactor guanylyltransferase [Chloroflexota bacterium]
MTAFSVAVIAGGKSARMGTDKAFVPLLGKPLIEHVLARVAGLGQSETLLITNQPAAYAHLKLPLYSDVLPEKGSLGGIYSALYYSAHPFTLCVACDMPFLNPSLLAHLLAQRGAQVDVIVPRVEGYPEGMHAVYSKACLPAIRARLDADQLKIIGFYDAVRVTYLDEAAWLPFDRHGLSFLNINTPEELQAAQKRAAGET